MYVGMCELGNESFVRRRRNRANEWEVHMQEQDQIDGLKRQVVASN